MTSAWGEIFPEGRAGRDGYYYGLAALFGTLAGWVDIKVSDLLLTAMVVLASCMLLGILRPRKPWRWVLLVGIFVPIVEWLAYFFRRSPSVPRSTNRSSPSFPASRAHSVAPWGATWLTICLRKSEPPARASPNRWYA